MLHTTITIGIGTPDEKPRAYLTGSDDDIPVIEFARGSGDHWQRASIALHFDDPAEQVAWLRGVAAAVEELAEQVEQRHGDSPGIALAKRHIAEAKAAAGIGQS
jgi:Mlc titration factor MtfA (ptsG expression regulator)